MSEKKENKPIMDPTFAESFYTTSMPPEYNGINYTNFTKTNKDSVDGTNYYGQSYNYYKFGDKISPNIGGLNYTSCQYLLPCGICERTGRQCPKHYGEYTWVPTCGSMTSKTHHAEDTYTTNKISGTYTNKSHKPTQEELEDFFKNK